MLLLITKKATPEQIKQAAEDFDSYFIKVVVDLEKEILTAGGQRHFDGEQLLLEAGSLQENLWGGGIEVTTKAIDYNSMINIRPRQDNPSKDILSQDIRKKFDTIVKKLLI